MREALHVAQTDPAPDGACRTESARSLPSRYALPYQGREVCRLWRLSVDEDLWLFGLTRPKTSNHSQSHLSFLSRDGDTWPLLFHFTALARGWSPLHPIFKKHGPIIIQLSRKIPPRFLKSEQQTAEDGLTIGKPFLLLPCSSAPLPLWVVSSEIPDIGLRCGRHSFRLILPFSRYSA